VATGLVSSRLMSTCTLSVILCGWVFVRQVLRAVVNELVSSQLGVEQVRGEPLDYIAVSYCAADWP